LIPTKRALRVSRLWRSCSASSRRPAPAHGQTAQVQTLSLDGVRAPAPRRRTKGPQLSAPSSLAVVDAAGELTLFEQMEGPRPVGIHLAVGRARSAARFRKATHSREAAIESGRSAAITAGAIQMGGGVPILLDGAVVGAVGVSGLDHRNDL
jgi:glc operon protein GlcG